MLTRLENLLVGVAAAAFLPIQLVGWFAFMVFAALRNGWWSAEVYFTRRNPK